MNPYERKIREINEIQKSHINSLIKGTREYFIKSKVDRLIEEGYSGDELLEKAKEELSGGRWVTIEGNHVYVDDGEVEAGVAYTGDKENPKLTPGEEIKEDNSDETNRSSTNEKKKDFDKEKKKKELISRMRGKDPKDKTPEAIREIRRQLNELKDS